MLLDERIKYIKYVKILYNKQLIQKYIFEKYKKHMGNIILCINDNLCNLNTHFKIVNTSILGIIWIFKEKDYLHHRNDDNTY